MTHGPLRNFHPSTAPECMRCVMLVHYALEENFVCAQCHVHKKLSAQCPVVPGVCRSCRRPRHPRGLVDMKHHLQAWVNGSKNDATGTVGFWVEFWCPMCPEDKKMAPLCVRCPFSYLAGLCTKKCRSVVCPSCVHAFVVPYEDMQYAQELVRNYKTLNGDLRQNLYPCNFSHCKELCRVPACNSAVCKLFCAVKTFLQPGWHAFWNTCEGQCVLGQIHGSHIPSLHGGRRCIHVTVTSGNMTGTLCRPWGSRVCIQVPRPSRAPAAPPGAPDGRRTRLVAQPTHNYLAGHLYKVHYFTRRHKRSPCSNGSHTYHTHRRPK